MSQFKPPPTSIANQLTLPLVAQGIAFCNESTCFLPTSKSGSGSAKKMYRRPSLSRDSSVGLRFLDSPQIEGRRVCVRVRRSYAGVSVKGLQEASEVDRS